MDLKSHRKSRDLIEPSSSSSLDRTDVPRVLNSHIDDFFEREYQESIAAQQRRIEALTSTIYPLKRRGRVLILNYVEFISSSRRQGSNIDVEALKKMFEFLNFNPPEVHDNLTRRETFTVLETERTRNHSESDCFVLIILSHGEPDSFHCKDKTIPYNSIFEMFTSDRCPTLVEKPKLFFFQCCRGEKFDAGSTLVYDCHNTPKKLPVTADIFAFFASFQDYYAWRNPGSGSWFIQELCKAVREFGETEDLLTIATFTCRAVALDRESNVMDDPERNKKKQMPTFMSTLTRRLFFFQ